MGTPCRTLSDFRSYKFGASSLVRSARWNVCALLLLFLLTGRGQAQDPAKQEQGPPAAQEQGPTPAQEQAPPPAAAAQSEPVGAVVEPHGIKEAKSSPKYDV